jgi:hypothetical protein
MPNVLSKCSGVATSVAAISTNPALVTSPWTVLTFLPMIVFALSSSACRRPVTKT